MKDWRSQAHVRWDCKYHVVIVPKYRQKRFFGSRRGQIGEILRQLCRQKGIELVEGHAMPDHIHLLLSVPPKYAIAFAIGYPLRGCSPALPRSVSPGAETIAHPNRKKRNDSQSLTQNHLQKLNLTPALTHPLSDRCLATG